MHDKLKVKSSTTLGNGKRWFINNPLKAHYALVAPNVDTG